MRRLLSQSPNSICAYNNIIIIILSLGIPTTGSYRRILVLPDCVSFGRAGLAGWRLATPPQFFSPLALLPGIIFAPVFLSAMLPLFLRVFVAGSLGFPSWRLPFVALDLRRLFAGVSSVSYCSEH
jgi:hypothetical protein